MAFFQDLPHKKWILLSLMAGAAVVQPLYTPEAKAAGDAPALVITNAPIPQSLRAKLYGEPRKVKEISASQLMGAGYVDGADTMVTQKVRMLTNDLNAVQHSLESLTGSVNAVQKNAEQKSAEYYANVATINTQLRAGTTPGNPRLVRRVEDARRNLEGLSEVVAQLNNEALRVAKVASEASFLLETAQASYGISGAVEEDHVKLSELEDRVNGTIVLIERLLNTVSDDITRTSAYLSTERENLRTLSLAVADGNLYGRSLAKRPFSNAPQYVPASVSGAEAQYSQQVQPVAQDMKPLSRQPLVKIKFDQADVNYEQALYVAVNDALDRYPQAQFDLVAVNPTQGNAAEVAIETTRARRNAERVLRTLSEMGLPQDRIDLSTDASEFVQSSEVHVFVR